MEADKLTGQFFLYKCILFSMYLLVYLEYLLIVKVSTKSQFLGEKKGKNTGT